MRHNAAWIVAGTHALVGCATTTGPDIMRDDMKNPRVAIDAAVAELFQRYSGVASNDT